eukprot:scaffold11724_cov124-Isochrysis_galbana.AAC.6
MRCTVGVVKQLLGQAAGLHQAQEVSVDRTDGPRGDERAMAGGGQKIAAGLPDVLEEGMPECRSRNAGMRNAGV